MRYLDHLRQKIRYNSLDRLFWDGLERLGLRVIHFYLMEEGLFGEPPAGLEQISNTFHLVELRPDDMAEIAAIAGRKLSSHEQLLARFKRGDTCFGLRQGDALAAFTWCAMKECTYLGRHQILQPDEAYLYDAYTMMDFRGKGLAPFLRYEVYRRLAEQGKTKLFSVSHKANQQSLHFKQKLHAKISGHSTHICLWNRWGHTFPIVYHANES